MYTYYNPKNHKALVLNDRHDWLAEELLDTKDDILIVYSSYSCAIKVLKWHSAEYAGGSEGLENIGEVPLPILLGCTGRTINCPDVKYLIY